MADHARRDAEAEDLWRAVFGNPPSKSLDTTEMLQRIVQHVPSARYRTLRRLGKIDPGC